MIKLREVGEIIMGQSPPSATYNKNGEGIPFFQGKAEFREIYPSPIVFCSEPIKIAEPNDILVSVRAPVGDVNIAPLKCCIGRGLVSIRPNNHKLHSFYLFYFLKSQKRKLESLSSGSTFKAVKKDDIENFLIPLPPLSEQKKIAEILSTVDKAIEKVDEAIEKTQKLKKGLMQELLTKGIGHKEFKDTEMGRIPREWEIVSLGYIGELRYGYTASATKKNTGIRFLRITDITDDRQINWEEVPYCEIRGDDFEKYKLAVGDILFARIGATTGKTAYVDKEVKGVFASYLIRFKPLLNGLYTKFLYHYTQSNTYWIQAHKNKEGQLKKGLNAKILATLKLPLPPLPEQKKIAEILSTVDKRLELLRKKREKLGRVKKGLMNDLLSGRKRVKV